MKTLYSHLLATFVLFNTNAIAQDGLPDSTFNLTGVKTITVAGYTNFQDVVVQPDGKILAGGSAVSINNDYDFLIARYNNDGSPDNSFGNAGKIMVDIGSTFDQVTALALQPDGKIIAGGKAISGGVAFDYALARFMPNGALDSIFGTNGKAIIDFNGNNDEATKMVLQPDGKIVLVGSTSNQLTGSIGLVRYLTNGTPDSTFNGTGFVQTLPDIGAFGGNDVALQADGKIVVAGSSFDNGITTLTLIRYNSSGQLDSSFATYGIALLPLLGGSSSGAGVAIQPDGKIVVTGAWIQTGNDAIVARYLTTGSLDGTFGSAGKVVLNLGSTENAKAILIQQDGKIILGCTADNICKIVKLNTNGSFDMSFNGMGIASTNFGNMNEMFNAVTLDTANKIIAVGNSGMDAGIARYTNSIGPIAIGIRETKNSRPSPLLLYPNPTSDKLSLLATDNDWHTINVYSISGQLLMNLPKPGNTISVEELRAGTYIIEALSTNKVYRASVIKK